ncbi:MAG: hypothetical protein ABJN22_13815 [Litorimonas sp.]
MNTLFKRGKSSNVFASRALTNDPVSAKAQFMEPAPIRNKPLFYGLVTISFGLLGLAIILLSV